MNKNYTLDKYSPVLVSIFNLSPRFTNKGTYTTAPVSTVQGFVAPVAVLPFSPGSHSVPSHSANSGGSTAKISPL